MRISTVAASFLLTLLPTFASAEAGFCSTSLDDFAGIEGHGEMRRMVCTDVAALDQPLVYNRFGSHNPFGMIFALRRDIVPLEDPSAPDCETDVTVPAARDDLSPGDVRLRTCKRPRPLTLRANVGDVVHVRVNNLLHKPEPLQAVDYSETFCRQGDEANTHWRGALRPHVSEGTPHDLLWPEEKADLRIGDNRGETRFIEALCQTGSTDQKISYSPEADAANWPRTRGISFVIDGLRTLPDPNTNEVNRVCTGLATLAPGDDPVDCYWHAEREGPFFINSVGAPSGDEGDGGSLTHGHFGSLAVEPQKQNTAPTQWYRSQVNRGTFDHAWATKASPLPHDRDGALNYAAIDGNGLPVLNLLHRLNNGN